MFLRSLKTTLQNRLFTGKVLILTGARQVGKTTLINEVIKDYKDQVVEINGDDPSSINLLENANLDKLRQIIGSKKILFIDEAQKIPNIGRTGKLIVDQMKEKQLILSGSSSFDLMNELREPLTGRKWVFNLYAISFNEWEHNIGFLKAEQELERRLVYGFYPSVINNKDLEKEELKELTESYLFKDIFQWSGLRKPEVLQKITQALAWQMGSEVKYSELSRTCNVDAKTVIQYMDILEKAFVIYKLPSFSSNQRNEIKNSRKVYFYDNGIRNALINDFSVFENRKDKGALWENFLVTERLKHLNYNRKYANSFFWRTKQQQEIDYIEKEDGLLKAFEFKWNPKRKASFSKTFLNNYEAETTIINRENFRDLINT